MTKLRFSAKVVKGAGRGKKLGIPTINFVPKIVKGLKEGIYVCKIVFPSGQYWGVLHFGPRPTFREKSQSLEAYLFDFDRVRVPKKLDIEIYSYIREIVKFANPGQMVNKIEKDIEIAKKRIKLLQNN
ncbi:hypothetical protein A3B52_03680 [Candidatus Curtissbacteria bacterium RIFCSPLOWO2_01_FULL_41_28]|uniref:riboflavin kinase n=1 Tax=Candidatus Curtissbacteria bacterium RIFOXYA1_FULL_41_14 TaxID=1797737 RepID=A0A1F5HB42_9BACT|nr:MAG: hypothetical protein A2683_01775 [Candidatus Curtissbacteria bacterium RIFCSPHIGHO2_01_FULL_34_40]OGD92654.1 MAG: hypothetical protein A3E14_02970 [Candidatus Curtissbacteria bacterium RIFCSPHIGHO2_12_FULL_41_13]OGD95524.1 MAG: hypothetical protein A3B52_03680 [Candidatus Curtissbacteria bacterium RIFCSPLOWO2_01_FULL_41_28]OGE01394.1 MAG: hypothetical protein A2196_04580 [Candidatus Curtissbacteria bacterium RIFOXYA1_FULL_41_14]OGE03989.1 MAG: hypothetical protein A2362_00260 [Candidatu